MIKEAAARLAEGSITDCDLTLDQFELPTHWIGNYESDLYAYAVAQISKGSDEQLLELHSHLFPGDGSAAVSLMGVVLGGQVPSASYQPHSQAPPAPLRVE
jgi:hypothetical protein